MLLQPYYHLHSLSLDLPFYASFALASSRLYHQQMVLVLQHYLPLWRISTGCGRTFNQTRIFGGFT